MSMGVAARPTVGSQFTLPYFPATSTRYASANPVSILPRQSTSVQIKHHSKPSSTNVHNQAQAPPSTTSDGEHKQPLPIQHRHQTKGQRHSANNLRNPRSGMPVQCGPEFYEARRKAWLTPRSKNKDSLPSPGSQPFPSPSSSTDSSSTSNPMTPSTASASASGPGRPLDPSRQRISELLATPGAVESEDIWNRGLSVLWRGLVTGSRFKKPLPLDIVIKILYAGWIRDGTWPAGATIPPSPPLELAGQLPHPHFPTVAMTRNPPPPLFSLQPGQKPTPASGNRGLATTTSSKTPRPSAPPSAHPRGGGKQGQRQNGLKEDEEEEEEDEADE